MKINIRKLSVGSAGLALITAAVVGINLYRHANRILSAAVKEAKNDNCPLALSLLWQTNSAYLNQADQLTSRYWRGVCNLKTERFSEASEDFKFVTSNDTSVQFRDAEFLLGQAQYGLKDYRSAKNGFEKSAQLGYRIGMSLYQAADSYTQLEQDTYAMKTFKQILELKGDEEMKEPALFRIAELYFERGETMRDKKVLKV